MFLLKIDLKIKFKLVVRALRTLEYLAAKNRKNRWLQPGFADYFNPQSCWMLGIQTSVSTWRLASGGN